MKLHPRVRVVWAVGNGITSVVAFTLGLAGVLGSLTSGLLPVWPSFIALVVWLASSGVAVVRWPQLAYDRWSYELGDDALELRHGVLMQTWSVIPYGRVQHVDVRQGPLERRLGLVELVVRTASAATDATLPGVTREQAEELRATILRRAGLHQGV